MKTFWKPISVFVLGVALMLSSANLSRSKSEIRTRKLDLDDTFCDCHLEINIPYLQDSLIDDIIEKSLHYVITQNIGSDSRLKGVENNYSCTYEDDTIISFMFSLFIMDRDAAYPVIKEYGLTIDKIKKTVVNVLELIEPLDWETYIAGASFDVLYGGLMLKDTQELVERAKKWCREPNNPQNYGYYLSSEGIVLLFSLSHVDGDYGEVLIEHSASLYREQ